MFRICFATILVAACTLLTAGHGLSAPVNDNFSQPQVIVGSSGNATGTNVSATMEPNEPFSETGSSSVWFTWTAPDDACMICDTVGSSFDTFLAVYTGEDLQSLMLIAFDDDSATSTRSRLCFTATEGAVYHIQVFEGFPSDTGEITLNWAFAGSGPPNDNFASARPIIGRLGSVVLTSDDATMECGEPEVLYDDGTGVGRSIWYRWTAPETVTTVFSTIGSNYDTILAIYTGSGLETLSLVGANDDFNDSPDRLSRVAISAVAGIEYYIRIEGYDQTSGTARLNWTPLRTVAARTRDVSHQMTEYASFHFLFTFAGKVVSATNNNLMLDDGGIRIMILAQGHGCGAGDFVKATGILNTNLATPTLVSSASQVTKLD
ncbi:MAG: hypothetical protein HYX78_12625 [Armatimonadetes bacterium]|nr:hypothetical protein [Armatimonadota bacterium]